MSHKFKAMLAIGASIVVGGCSVHITFPSSPPIAVEVNSKYGQEPPTISNILYADSNTTDTSKKDTNPQSVCHMDAALQLLPPFDIDRYQQDETTQRLLKDALRHIRAVDTYLEGVRRNGNCTQQEG